MHFNLENKTNKVDFFPPKWDSSKVSTATNKELILHTKIYLSLNSLLPRS